MSEMKFIECNVSGNTYYINMQSIIAIEAKGHYLIITTISAEYVVRDSLKRFLTYLDADFYQVHRSFVINLNYIIACSHTEITLQEEQIIPIGRIYKEAFLTRIKELANKKEAIIRKS